MNSQLIKLIDVIENGGIELVKLIT